jgi:glutamate racemase
MIDPSEVRHVLPDGDTRIGSDGFVGMTDYMIAMSAAYLQACREGVVGVLAEAATIDAEMARKVANTDADALAEALFKRHMLPMLEAHFERGHETHAGRSVDH